MPSQTQDVECTGSESQGWAQSPSHGLRGRRDLCLNTPEEISRSLGLKSQWPLGVQELQVANDTEQTLQLGSMNMPVQGWSQYSRAEIMVQTLTLGILTGTLFAVALPIELKASCCCRWSSLQRAKLEHQKVAVCAKLFCLCVTSKMQDGKCYVLQKIFIGVDHIWQIHLQHVSFCQVIHRGTRKYHLTHMK